MTVRKVSKKAVHSRKARARRSDAAAEQGVRERAAALEQIAASWAKQTRRPTAAEIDSWINVGRP